MDFKLSQKTNKKNKTKQKKKNTKALNSKEMNQQ